MKSHIGKLTLMLGILALVLAGCGQKQYVCEDGTTVQDPSQCPGQEDMEEQPAADQEQPEQEETPAAPEDPDTTEETIEEGQPAEEGQEVEKSISSEVQGLIDSAEDVSSYSFVYSGPGLPQHTYYVKGDMVVVELKKATDYKLSQNFTHVYIDTSTSEAMAYCNVDDKNRCPNGIQSHGSVDMDEYYVKTPLDWLKSLQTAETLGGGPQFEQRNTVRVDFTAEDGTSGEIHALDFYGLPGRVKMDDGTVIEFKDLSIGNVADDKITPPEV